MLAKVLMFVALWVAPPNPSPYPAVHNDQCPFFDISPCYVGGHGWNDVYLSGTTYQFTIQHELGHAYDHNNLNDGERAAIARVMQWDSWDKEMFADLYAGCRLRLNPINRYIRDDGIFGKFGTVQRVARRCNKIARAA